MVIYSHPLLYQVINVQNLLKLSGISTGVRNQYASGAAGDLAIGETWVELWLDDDRDHLIAQRIIGNMLSVQVDDWYCGHCGEKNAGSFDICWQCQKPRKY